MKKTIISVIMFVLLLSCSKKENYTIEVENGINRIKNNGKNREKYELKPKKLFRIMDERTNGVMHVQANDKNIFVLGWGQGSVHKYDLDGKYISSIGQKGQGPGEFIVPFFTLTFKDSIYVYHGNNFPVVNSCSIFNQNNMFIRKQVTENLIMMRMDNSKSNVVRNEIVGEVINNEWFGHIRVNILDNHFNSLAKIPTISYSGNGGYNPLQGHTPFALNSDKIYIASVSEHKYEITEYDIKGEVVSLFSKSYAKTKLNKAESDILFGQWTAGFVKKDVQYKVAINNMYLDKNGYLLVHASRNLKDSNISNSTLDVFKDGIYINSIKLDIGEINDFPGTISLSFSENRIYYTNSDEGFIDVYEY